MSVDIPSKKITHFLIPVIAYVIFLLAILIAYGYKGSFLMLNGAKYQWLDLPMFIITHLGDSLILGSMLTMILVWKKPHAVTNLILIVIITGLFGQLLKIFFFDGWDRPLRVFNESPIVHTMPNYRLFHNSFPSGHSITVMAALTSLVWSMRPRGIVQLVIAALAILVSYSRVYLGVHFPGDVLTGSFIGVVMTLILLPYINRTVSKITFSRPIKISIACLGLLLFISGIWLTSIYFPAL